MGMFGNLGRSISQPGSSGLSFADRARIFAIAMQDPGAAYQMKQGLRLKPQRDAFMSDLQQRVAGTPDTVEQARIMGGEGDITAAFAPQYDLKRGQAPLDVNSPDLPSLALRAQQLGVPIGQLLDTLKAQQPNVQVGPSGEAFNANDRANIGRIFPKLGEGIRPTREGGAEMVPDYDRAIAGIEGAKTGAQEAAKAGYDMVEVKVGGSVVQLPRSVALPLITAAFGQANPDGLPADFGRTRTPEEQAILTGRAGNAVKQEGMVGEATVQAGLDLPKVRDQAGTTIAILNKIRNHPSLDARTGNSTLLPAIRSQDVDFDALVKQVSGGAFLEAIQALKGTGQITEIEGKKATDAIARMSNQRQSKEGFLEAMQDYEDVVTAGQSRAARRAGAPTGRPPQRPPSRAALEAEARRRGLLK